jgi:hypothetical protein
MIARGTLGVWRRGARRRRARSRRHVAAGALGIGIGVAAAIGVSETREQGAPQTMAGARLVAPQRPIDHAVVWAVGEAGRAGAKAVTALIAQDPLDRLLYLGDVYDHGSARGFVRYQATYGRLADLTAPTPGSHDAADRAVGYDPYWRQTLGRPIAHWYALRAGGWTLLGLDSEAPHAIGSPQYRWLRGHLRAAGTCRLAFWNRPRYSAAARHRDQPDLASLWDALRGHATIVVAAHAHNMQRLRPIDGITELISGAGGAKLQVPPADRRLAFAQGRAFGALRLVLRPSAAEYAFLAADGRILDLGTLRCRRR